MKFVIRIALVSFFFVSSLFTQSLSKNELDTFINNIMKEYKLPGLSIAVVKNDSVIFANGYGVKKIGEADMVNEHTLFQAASITKTFTALLMGMLVDQGKVKWNDPVKKFIPEFELSDPHITDKVTLRDLLTFRSGILDGDTLKASSRKELIPLLKKLKVTNSFRITQSSYNLNYTLAGYVAEQIWNKNYGDIVSSELLFPLNMKETFLSNAAALSSSKNVSVPHILKDYNILSITWNDFGVYAPAGCIITNVVNISKFVQLVLSGGVYNGKSIIKKETLAQMQKPQTFMDDSWKQLFNPTANFITTGLGFVISDYKGYKLVEMDGAATGTSNTMTMIPSEKIGVIVQTNMDWAFDALVKIKFFVLDKFISSK